MYPLSGLFSKELTPIAIFPDPLSLIKRASLPIPMLLFPLSLSRSALWPIAVLAAPALLARRAWCPTAVHWDPDWLAARTAYPRAVFEETEPPPLPTVIAFGSVPLILISWFSKLAAPFTVNVSVLASPNVTFPSTVRAWLIWVVPVEAPILINVAAPPKSMSNADVLIRSNALLEVRILSTIVGLVSNINLPDPDLSWILPDNWVDVVKANCPKW